MSILNFNTLDRIQKLKENLAQKDKEIIKPDKQDLSEQRDSIKLIDEPAEPIVLQVSPRDFDLEEFENWLKITNTNFNLSPEMRLKLMLKNKTDK